MVETTESDHHELVIKIIRRLCRRQLHSHIVACEAMHRPAPGGFLEEHLRFLSDISGIERLCLLVGKFYEALAPQFLVLVGNHIWDTQGGSARAL